MASIEYLEEIWSLAKDQLPGWAYASLRAQAMPKAGGRVAHRKETPNTLERLALEQLTPKGLHKLKDADLQEAWGALGRWHKSAKKQKLPTDRFLSSGQWIVQELTKRKIKIKESPFVQELASSMTRVTKEMREHITPRYLTGPEQALIAFVGCSTSKEEQAFDDALKVMVEKQGWNFGEILRTGEYLSDWSGLLQELDELQTPIVVALGKVAKEALGDRADIFLPHPLAVVKHHDSGEIARKFKVLSRSLKEKSLDTVTGSGADLDLSARGEQVTLIYKPTLETPDKDTHLADVISENTGSGVTKGENCVRIQKTDSTKHIVYAAVVDPYGKNGAQPDAHNDWIPPGAVEETAHKYMRSPMVIGMQHTDEAQARVVESWVEDYPSPEDYQKALAGKDHSVYRRKFGDDVVHSGSWMLGVKLGDEEWKAYEKGEINAFSPGGFGIRSPLSPSEMPKVTFIDLVPKEGVVA